MPRQFKINDAMRKQLIAAFAAAGISASAAFVAWDVTVPSEGVYDPYLDPVGLPTVCVGHMDRTLDMTKTYTLEECMKLFAKDWDKHAAQLQSKVKVSYRSEWQYGALVDFTFNKGIGNLASSTLLKDVNAQRHDKACVELTKWVYAKDPRTKTKIVLPGLQIRATKQFKYCMGELTYDKLQAYEAFRKEYQNEIDKKHKEGL